MKVTLLAAGGVAALTGRGRSIFAPAPQRHNPSQPKSPFNSQGCSRASSTPPYHAGHDETNDCNISILGRIQYRTAEGTVSERCPDIWSL